MKKAIKRKLLKRYKKYRNRIKHKGAIIFLDKIIDYLYPNEDFLFATSNYKLQFEEDLNLEMPRTFNEKIQWLKLNDRTQLHVKCADKIAVRDYVKEKIGEHYLIPLIFSTKKATKITPKILPDYPVIIKANHDSGSYIIVREKNKLNWKEIRLMFKKALEFNYYFNLREWQYKNISPQILIEKLLIKKDGSIPEDYKFHCFNGKVKYIQVDLDRETKHTRNMYNINWTLLDLEFHYPKGTYSPPPVCLEKMISLAEKLAISFYYVRIDFYQINNDIFFGEITFHPEGGFGKFNPKKWDLIFGEQLKLPISIQ